MNTLPVLVCRTIVTHNYYFSTAFTPKVYTPPTFSELRIINSCDIIHHNISKCFISIIGQMGKQRQNHEASFTRSCSKTPVKPRTNVMVLLSMCKTHRCTNITSPIIPPTLDLKARILVEIYVYLQNIYILKPFLY